MGIKGPYPERSDKLIRRNKREDPIDTISVIGPVDIPELGLPDPHPLVTDFYNSLKDSAQSKYYEPSDWNYARIAMLVIDEMLRYPGGVGAMKLTAVNQMLSSLLVTEGDRRRVRIEVQRDAQAGGNVIEVADIFRERLKQQG